MSDTRRVGFEEIFPTDKMFLVRTGGKRKRLASITTCPSVRRESKTVASKLHRNILNCVIQ